MSGNIESRSGCAIECRERFLNCFSRIRKFPFDQCCLYFLKQLDDHIFASITLFICFGLTASTWFIFSLSASLIFSLYCIVLIFCAFLSRVYPRGCRCIRQEEKNRQLRQTGREINQSSRVPARAVGQPLPQVLNVEDQKPGDVAAVSEGRPVMLHHAEVYNADEVSEASNMDEPTSMSSDEPLKQAEPSVSRINLPRSSTDASSPSTSTTPLE